MAFANLILLAEDSEDDELSFKEALNRSGLRNPVRAVRDGHAVVGYLGGHGECANRERFPLPGILLLDLDLPKMSGWDVLQWVRSQAEFKDLLVVVLTGSVRAGDLRRTYQMGANSFLVKSCKPEDLVALANGFPKHWETQEFRRAPRLPQEGPPDRSLTLEGAGTTPL